MVGVHWRIGSPGSSGLTRVDCSGGSLIFLKNSAPIALDVMNSGRQAIDPLFVASMPLNSVGKGLDRISNINLCDSSMCDL